MALSKFLLLSSMLSVSLYTLAVPVEGRCVLINNNTADDAEMLFRSSADMDGMGPGALKNIPAHGNNTYCYPMILMWDRNAVTTITHDVWFLDNVMVPDQRINHLGIHLESQGHGTCNIVGVYPNYEIHCVDGQ